MVFCSDLRRAVETVEIAFPFPFREVPVHRDTRLRECDFGELNGMPVPSWPGCTAGTSTNPFQVGRATGRWSMADLVHAPFDWRPGWSYRLPSAWGSDRPPPARAQPGQPAPERG